MIPDDVETRQIPGYSRYLAGNDGEVYSVVSGQPRRLKVAVRKEDGRGRLSITSDSGKLHRKYRSYFILLAWVGGCPAGSECLHSDGNCRNDKPDNLRWGTSTENKADMLIHGTRLVGTQINTAKLSRCDVLAIRSMRESGVPLEVIARQFSITATNVSYIHKRKTWRSVT